MLSGVGTQITATSAFTIGENSVVADSVPALPFKSDDTLSEEMSDTYETPLLMLSTRFGSISITTTPNPDSAKATASGRPT